MSKIDRAAAQKLFGEYTDQYNSADPKIKLKIDHTYRVAKLCERIGKSIGLVDKELDIAWMCGLLHDIGRFEQIRRYGTFSDADSIDHARLSKMILFGENEESHGMIRQFIADNQWDELIKTAVEWHSAYRIPEELGERTAMYCNILRDADKIDILRVNLDTPMEDIYNVSTETLRSSQVTPEVMQAFDEHHAVKRALKRTAVDYPVGHISLVYELVYPVSRHIVKEQGYLTRLMNFETVNPMTKQQFAHIREEMGHFLEQE